MIGSPYMTGNNVDFTIYKHPWCARPSGHKASDFHKSRKIEADRAFVENYGRMQALSAKALDGG